MAVFGSVVFLVGVAVLAALGRLPWLLWGWYLIASIVTYGTYAADKDAAVEGRWRVANLTLHVLGLIGGWPGAWMGQQVLRNKNRQPTFQVMLFLSISLHLLLVSGLAFADRSAGSRHPSQPSTTLLSFHSEKAPGSWESRAKKNRHQASLRRVQMRLNDPRSPSNSPALTVSGKEGSSRTTER